MKLTDAKVARIKEAGRYSDGYGVYLQVISPTNRSWLFRYTFGGKERWMGLGPVHIFENLEEVRDKARLARRLLKDGVDPLEHRAVAQAAKALEAAKALTFADAAQQYFEQHSAKWQNAKHRDQFLSSLKEYAFPIIGRLSVAAIDTGLVLKVIEPIWHRKTTTANRVRGRIENVLDFATVRGARTGDNPARWRGHLDNVLPERAQIAKVAHHKALNYAALPDFMIDLAKREGMPARALEFLIFTAARTGEVLGARWSEIDDVEKVWTIPANRMKSKREHRVPLSEPAIALLAALPRESDYLFPGARKNSSINDIAMVVVLKNMNRRDTTVHGLRSTFRDWAGNETHFPREIAEAALAHVVGDAAEQAYRRNDALEKRRRLMADWGRFCTEPQRDATVIRLNR